MFTSCSHHCPVFIYTFWPSSLEFPHQTQENACCTGWMVTHSMTWSWNFPIIRLRRDKGEACDKEAGWSEEEAGTHKELRQVSKPKSRHGPSHLWRDCSSLTNSNFLVWHPKMPSRGLSAQKPSLELTRHSYMCSSLTGIWHDLPTALWGSLHFKDEATELQKEPAICLTWMNL
jgi:hypothetical protein